MIYTIDTVETVDTVDTVDTVILFSQSALHCLTSAQCAVWAVCFPSNRTS